MARQYRKRVSGDQSEIGLSDDAPGAASAAGTGTGTDDSGIGDSGTANRNGRGEGSPIPSREGAEAENRLEVVNEPPAKKRGRAPSKKRQADSASAAGVILDTLDVFGREAFGEDGGFQPIERALMEDPLARVLARTDPAKMGQYAAVLDPILLGAGMLLYAVRVNRIVGERKPAKPPAPPLHQVMRANPESDPSAGAVLRQDLTPIGGIS